MKADSVTYARFGVRVAAGTIDLTLLALAVAVLSWLGIEIQAADLDSRAELYDAIARLWSEVLLVPVGVLMVAAMTLSWERFLATPGQLLMGCRVLRRGPAKSLNPFIALWRAVAMLMLAGPAAVPLLTMFFDRRRRAAHDWLSDCVVVVEDESQASLDEWLSELD
ncbi:MAG TPA: RDD family protein [Gammaproteobacteria bacterium]|nr:RDD family protein [Gammaproteobacteria bacterium]